MSHRHILALRIVLGVLLLLGLGGCASIECRAPLARTQCDGAVRDADAWLATHGDFQWDSASDARASTVTTACGDPCDEDQDGKAIVRYVTQNDFSPGAVVICIDEERCGDEPPSFLFP